MFTSSGKDNSSIPQSCCTVQNMNLTDSQSLFICYRGRPNFGFVLVTVPKLGRTPLSAWFWFRREDMQVTFGYGRMCDWFRCKVTETVDCCLVFAVHCIHAFSTLHDKLTQSQHLWHGSSYPEWLANNGLMSVLMTAGEPALSGRPLFKCWRLFGVMLQPPQLSRLTDVCSQPQ